MIQKLLFSLAALVLVAFPAGAQTPAPQHELKAGYIALMVTGEVLPGQMDNFRQLVTRLVAAVAEEPGTLVYEFSLQPAPARRVTRGVRLSARSSSSREEPKVRRLVAAV